MGEVFGFILESPRSLKIIQNRTKCPPAWHFFPITENVRKNLDFWTLPDRLRKALVRAGAPFSLFQLSPKRVPK